jgi:hypothetical protein|tara:strand:- start:19 stop:3369 length:3351 start_codon:yes stop_codon:yes gene_type:complete
MAEQEPVFIDPFASDPSTPERVFIDPFEVVEDPDAVPTILEIAEEEPDAISTQMYSGLNFLEAREKYESIIEGDDVTKPLLGFLGYAVYKDPDTGRSEYIPQPDMKMFGKDGQFDNLSEWFSGLFTADMERMGAAFDDTQATVDPASKVILGLSETTGAGIEAVAAGVDKIPGVDGVMNAVSPLVANIDTGDSFTDAILTDAVPAVVTSFGGGKLALDAMIKAAPSITSKMIKGFAVLLGAETGAAIGTSTDEGTMFLGGTEASLLPIAQGLDIGDSAADKVIEQRINTLIEGMFLNSALSGLVLTAAEVSKMAAKFGILPILTVGNESVITKRIYDELTESLIKIDVSSTPTQIAEAKRELAKIVEANKEILLPEIENLKNLPVPVDTLSALLRGTASPEDMARISGVRAGKIQKADGNSALIAASEGPARQLEETIDSRLADVSSEVPAEQVNTIAGAADELATDARAAVAARDLTRVDAEIGFDKAAQEVVDGLKNADLELGGQISRLEEVTGTDIVTGMNTSFEQVREGLIKAKTEMTQTKDALYDAIPEGTAFDYQGFADLVNSAVEQIDLLDTSGTRTKSIDLINTIRSVLKPRTVVADASPVPFGVRGTTTSTTEVGELAEELLSGGVDFRTLYKRVRPELSKLIDQAYKRGDDIVASRLVDVKRAIDDQVEWVANNSGEEAADAAKAAYEYYSKEYAPLWRDGGVVADFGDMYEPVLSRGTQNAGFRENSNALVTSVLSGQNADAVINMKTALEKVADPKPIADYMIADVITGFASKVRSDGAMSPDALKGMSENLRQYAVSLNAAFPDRAKQLNQLVAAIENAAGNKRLVEQALEEADKLATQTRADVKKSELGKFLSNVYGREMSTTLNPEQAFVKIFRESEGIGTVQDIIARLADMPPARAKVVRDGLETAYLRFLSERITGAKVTSAGTKTLKGSNVDRALEEADNLINIGREIYSGQPERMETIEILLDAARMIDKSKQATPVPGMSATAFNKEALQATNRLIMTFIGPLSRIGAKVRTLSGAAFDALDPTKRAQTILDNILANPDRFLELSKKYDSYPMDPVIYERLITAITSGGIKAVNAEQEYMFDQNNVDQQMMDLVPQ